MGGINDLRLGFKPSEAFNNLVVICEQLVANDIEPIIQSTLSYAKTRSDYKERNEQVDELNKMLEGYCKKNSIVFINVNEKLSPDGFLIEDYTYDGVHLMGKAYGVWKELITPYL